MSNYTQRLCCYKAIYLARFISSNYIHIQISLKIQIIEIISYRTECSRMAPSMPNLVFGNSAEFYFSRIARNKSGMVGSALMTI